MVYTVKTHSSGTASVYLKVMRRRRRERRRRRRLIPRVLKAEDGTNAA